MDKKNMMRKTQAEFKIQSLPPRSVKYGGREVLRCYLSFVTSSGYAKLDPFFEKLSKSVETFLTNKLEPYVCNICSRERYRRFRYKFISELENLTDNLRTVTMRAELSDSYGGIVDSFAFTLVIDPAIGTLVPVSDFIKNYCTLDDGVSSNKRFMRKLSDPKTLIYIRNDSVYLLLLTEFKFADIGTTEQDNKRLSGSLPPNCICLGKVTKCYSQS